MTTTALMVPGLWDSGPEHWHTLWEADNPSFARVHQYEWDAAERRELLADCATHAGHRYVDAVTELFRRERSGMHQEPGCGAWRGMRIGRVFRNR